MLEIIEELTKELTSLQYNLNDYTTSSTTLNSYGDRIEALALHANFKSDAFSKLVKNDGINYTKANWESTRRKFLGALQIMQDNFNMETNNPAQSPRSSREIRFTKSSDTQNNRIFIVHGHDEVMKLSTARTIEKLGLTPIILHEQPSGGKTIIEKIDQYSDVGFAIVLLSPDDLGHKKNEPSKNAKPRARQNVILELGFFLGRLGRSRVIALYMPENNFEMPSDYNGVLYIAFDNAGKWKFDLVKELQICGFMIDANKILD